MKFDLKTVETKAKAPQIVNLSALINTLETSPLSSTLIVHKSGYTLSKFAFILFAKSWTVNAWNPKVGSEEKLTKLSFKT